MSMIEDSECVSRASLAIFLALFLWLIMFQVTRDLMAAKKLVQIWYRFHFFVIIFYIFFIISFYLIYSFFFCFLFFVYIPDLILDNLNNRPLQHFPPLLIYIISVAESIYINISINYRTVLRKIWSTFPEFFNIIQVILYVSDN